MNIFKCRHPYHRHFPKSKIWLNWLVICNFGTMGVQRNLYRHLNRYRLSIVNVCVKDPWGQLNITMLSYWSRNSQFNMMTSSNGNIFRVTGPLCWEFTGHRWIPLTKASDAELWWFSVICGWIKVWVNIREAGDLRCHRAHYDVPVMNHKGYHDRLFFTMEIRIPDKTVLILRQGQALSWSVQLWLVEFALVGIIDMF